MVSVSINSSSDIPPPLALEGTVLAGRVSLRRVEKGPPAAGGEGTTSVGGLSRPPTLGVVTRLGVVGVVVVTTVVGMGPAAPPLGTEGETDLLGCTSTSASAVPSVPDPTEVLLLVDLVESGDPPTFFDLLLKKGSNGFRLLIQMTLQR